MGESLHVNEKKVAVRIKAPWCPSMQGLSAGLRMVRKDDVSGRNCANKLPPLPLPSLRLSDSTGVTLTGHNVKGHLMLIKRREVPSKTVAQNTVQVTGSCEIRKKRWLESRGCPLHQEPGLDPDSTLQPTGRFYSNEESPLGLSSANCSQERTPPTS